MRLTNEQIQQVLNFLDNYQSNLSNNQLTPIIDQAKLKDEDFPRQVMQFLYRYVGLGQNILRYTTIIPAKAFADLNLGANTFYVPNSVKLDPYAFAQANLTSIRIESPTIPAFCFSQSTVRQIELGEGVTEIDNNAFANCPNLELIVWPQSLRLVKKDAFKNCRPDAKDKLTIKCPAELLSNGSTVDIEGYFSETTPEDPDIIDFYTEVIEVIGEPTMDFPDEDVTETAEATNEAPVADEGTMDDTPIEESLVEAKKDLGTVSGSMTSILKDNLKKFNTAKTVAELVDMIEKLFEEEGLDTKASNRLIATIEKKRNIGDAYMALYNSILSGSGLSVL